LTQQNQHPAFKTFSKETMFKNYLKVAIRNLIRNPVYSAINVLGLALGIACFTLILLYVQKQVSYDRFHDNYDRIYRLVTNLKQGDSIVRFASSVPPAASALQSEFPEIEQAVRFIRPFTGHPVLRYADRRFAESLFLYADPEVFEIFSFTLERGDPKTALSEPNTIVLTKASAKKYFGDEDPLGKTIVFHDSLGLKVTGLLQDRPGDSHLEFEFLCSMGTVDNTMPRLLNLWKSAVCFTYLMLPPNYDYQALEERFPQLLNKHLDPEQVQMTLKLEPLHDIFLRSSRPSFAGPTGSITYVYALSAIAVFILLVACVNFVNLSTARSAQRAKEIGMRKVLGAHRGRLIKQFLLESLLLAVAASMLGILIIQISQPVFAELAGQSISVDFVANRLVIPGLVMTTLVIGLIAGGYPAFYLSRHRPASTLREVRRRDAPYLRRGLVIFQFTVSTALIICTAIAYSQVHFMQNKDYGFTKEHILSVPVGAGTLGRQAEALQNRLLAHPNITDVTRSLNVPGGLVIGLDYRLEGKPVNQISNISAFLIDENFLPTFGVELVDGRNFSEAFGADKKEAFLINETAARQFGWQDN
jgi:putative ABC transport system permease protein